MIKFYVNGELVEFGADPETPLLWVLRDNLKLTGAKYGCGMGVCGACTVFANREPIRACSTPVSALAGKLITTIEGLEATNTVAKAVKNAWIDKDVAQCGYCEPGQIMSAVALLAKNKSPSDADIDAAMNGNLCRCGTYQRVREAIRAAGVALGGKA